MVCSQFCQQKCTCEREGKQGHGDEHGREKEGEEMDQGKAQQQRAGEIHTALTISDSCSACQQRSEY